MSDKVVEENQTNWEVPQVISARLEVPDWACKNVVQLLDQGCTIPFIARYRKEQTGDMAVDKIRGISVLLEELRVVQNKITSVKANIAKLGKMTKALDAALKNAQTMTEVEDLYAPYKPGNKGSLAERARALGLEPLAQSYLDATDGTSLQLEKYINSAEKGLASLAKIETGVQHILADIIHKDKETMEQVRAYCSNSYDVMIESSEAKTVKKKEEEKVKLAPSKKEQKNNYENYFNSKFSAKTIKPHQVLALNRGEENKILSIKVTIPERIKRSLCTMLKHKWIKHNASSEARRMINLSITDAYDRKIEPQMCRLVRSNLTKAAETSSIDVFANNLKHLLLQPPVRGMTILAIDPGFRNGCKMAVISPTGQILLTDILYIHSSNANKKQERDKLFSIIHNHRCEIFAIGNGVACRETECYISDIIRTLPRMKYSIVDESGASIYSVSDAAQAELPNLEPSLRGAVSIGRRLLDPLAELVKIEPKHIGVGQYQHDMPQNKLKTSLDSVVEECVSFVGVDLNTCSECILRKVAGMSKLRAKNVMDWREKNGRFVCREQLLTVKGLGDKSYEQAAGFVRVHHMGKMEQQEEDTKEQPQAAAEVKPKQGTKRKAPAKKTTAAKKKKVEDFKANPLDMTWIHPESYEIAHNLMDKIGVNVQDLGTRDFIRRVETYLRTSSIPSLAEALDCGAPTVKLICDALCKPLTYDFREAFEKPLFRSAVMSLQELRVGTVLTGKVTNVTHFGAFVDIGVGQDGLIHTSKMAGKHCQLGNKVEISPLSLQACLHVALPSQGCWFRFLTRLFDVCFHT